MSHTTTPKELRLRKRMERNDGSLPNIFAPFLLEPMAEEAEREGSYFPELPTSYKSELPIVVGQ